MSDALDKDIEKISLFDLRSRYKNCLLDWADDDTRARELAARVLPQEWIDGDTFAVPGIVDIVEKLVEEIEAKK